MQRRYGNDDEEDEDEDEDDEEDKEAEEEEVRIQCAVPFSPMTTHHLHKHPNVTNRTLLIGRGGSGGRGKGGGD